MIDSTGHTRPKPHPEVFLLAMQRLGVRADECWIMEDSVNGLRAARAAQSFAVAITTTFDRETLTTAGADVVVESFGELQTILESL
jgi:sugar-phosphatase